MKTWIFVAILLGLISGGVYFYYTTTQDRISELVATNSSLVAVRDQLVEANQQTVAAFDELVADHEQVRENFTALQREFQQIRQQNFALRERLGRHDLGALAAARPGLVERTVNNASVNVARCFELLSGAPLNERERNATNENQFNSECPWLWPGHNAP